MLAGRLHPLSPGCCLIYLTIPQEGFVKRHQ
ncbi:hypothetical protein BLA17378_04515 [Burkholderia aenigmatica]|uniref:Uncharacterized protein n=1 Tax=Burkholderia aenigmatica TaxID=2015348 RepID=A0ABY6XVK9_9BURK|nr:hypothetical protein BLA17378_04515 [Burkholderia aenigmatica]